MNSFTEKNSLVIHNSYRDIKTAKNNEQVSIFHDGRSMFSMYDPSKDGDSFASDKDFNNAGYIIILGAGSSYHIRSLAAKYPQKNILVIENSLQSLHFLGIHDDVFKSVFNGNISAAYPGIIKKILIETYSPVFDGTIICKAQRVWAEYHQNIVPLIFSEISEALDEIKDDFSVQSHFGFVWFKNFLKNSVYLQNSINNNDLLQLMKSSNKKAAIIAAGPSLDISLKYLKNNRDSYYVISTDTALPVLCSNGIAPDAFVCIDPQPISSNHFHHPLLQPCTAVIDITASNAAVRYAVNNKCSIVFTRNKHPLCTFLSSQLKHLPFITSGAGTVTSAAAEYASLCGYNDLDFFGADFSYHHGKPYAKGTYLDQIYADQSNRFNPAEQSFISLMYRTETSPAEFNHQSYGITTQTLISYTKSLNNFIKENKINTSVQFENYSLLKSRNFIYAENPRKTVTERQSTIELKSLLKDIISAAEQLEKMTFDYIKKNRSPASEAFIPLAAWLLKNKKLTETASFFDSLILAKKLIGNYTVSYHE